MRLKVIYSSLLILLVGCTSELPQAPDLDRGQEPEVPVSFTYAVETKQDIDSRAPIELTYLPNGSQIGIYALEGTMDGNDKFNYINPSNAWAEDNLQPNFLNACYEAQTLDDSGMFIHRLNAKGKTGAFPKAENAALQFFAYYPYTEEVIFERGLGHPVAPKIPIKIDPEIENTPDYLYTGPIVAQASANEPVQLTFKHALSKLEIYITTEQKFTARKCPKVTQLEIGTNYSQEGTLDINTGEIQYKDESEYWDFEKEISEQDQNIYPNKNDSPRCSFLFLPGENPLYYLRFHVTTTFGEEKTFELNAENTPSLGNIVLRSGYTTKLYLTYKLDH